MTAVITALGAVTSVGFDAITTSASIRAALSRPETLIEHKVLDREAHTSVGVTGTHPRTLKRLSTVSTSTADPSTPASVHKPQRMVRPA